MRWDCGGGESFVYAELDGVEQRFDYADEYDLGVLLSDYLTELLNLPEAGEFSLEGIERIFWEGPAVMLEYQLRAVVYWDDFSDEELEAMGVASADKPILEAKKEENEVEEPQEQVDQQMSDEYSSQRVLFTVSGD